MVTRDNALEIAPNHAKLRENVWQRVWKHVEGIVTHCIIA